MHHPQCLRFAKLNRVKTHRAALAGTALSISGFCSVAACGGFSSSPTPPTTIDAATDAPLTLTDVAADNAVDDGVPRLDDASADAPLVDECEGVQFAANFDGDAQTPADSWSSRTDDSTFTDGGPASAGAIELTDLHTTAPRGVRFRGLANNRPDGGRLLLNRVSTWNQRCVRASFDITVPLRGDGGAPGGEFVAASLSPWKEALAIGVLVEPTDEDFTVRILGVGGNTLTAVGAPITRSRGIWVRVTLTARMVGNAGSYESEVVAAPNSLKGSLSIQESVVPADSYLLSIGSSTDTPVATEVVFDTVVVSSRPTSSVPNP